MAEYHDGVTLYKFELTRAPRRLTMRPQIQFPDWEDAVDYITKEYGIPRHKIQVHTAFPMGREGTAFYSPLKIGIALSAVKGKLFKKIYLDIYPN